ncbi:hypothetical protein [Variovorax sp. tm]|uniref:hypothetical protein n=1 Tax=Variovorax atrisoli TaxID=3394203 RepID=UPI003A802EDD
MERILVATKVRVLSINEAVWIFAVAVPRERAIRSFAGDQRNRTRSGARRAGAHHLHIAGQIIEPVLIDSSC